MFVGSNLWLNFQMIYILGIRADQIRIVPSGLKGNCRILYSPDEGTFKVFTFWWQSQNGGHTTDKNLF